MYLNPQQAADALKMSRQWLYQLIRRGEVTTANVAGKRLVIDDDQFKALRRARSKASGLAKSAA